MEKIKNVEFLRLICIVQIMLIHLFCTRGLLEALPCDVPLYKHLHLTTAYGNLGVDFFFIMAGFFLVYTYKDVPVGEFIKHKFARLFPAVLLMVILMFVLSVLFSDINFDKYMAIFTLTFTSQLGFLKNQIGFVWFVSSLFWGLLFYYYCIKFFPRKNNDLIFALLVIFVYAILFNLPIGFGNVVPNVWGFLNIGTLRAIAGIGVGYFIGNWYKDNYNEIKNTSLSIFKKIIFTLLEGLLLFFVIYYTTLHTFKHTKMVLIFAFIVLFILFISKKGYISRFFDNNIFSFLGKYVYYIYIMERVVHSYLKHLFASCSFEKIGSGLGLLIAIMLAEVILGAIAYHIVDYVKKVYKKLAKERLEL